MLCPEGEVPVNDEEKCDIEKEHALPAEGNGNFELHAYKNPLKSWKKSITKLFRHQLRSTRSNEGDVPSVSNEKFDDTEEVPREQKWQSLGKIFKRQSNCESWDKSSSSPGEGSTHRRFHVKKVFTNYFGKHNDQ